MQRRVGLRLHDVDQPLAHELENRGEGDADTHAPFCGPEQLLERHEARALAEGCEDLAHALAHRQPLALNVMVGEHLRTHHDILECEQHFLQRDVRQRAQQLAFLELR